VCDVLEFRTVVVLFTLSQVAYTQQQQCLTELHSFGAGTLL